MAVFSLTDIHIFEQTKGHFVTRWPRRVQDAKEGISKEHRNPILESRCKSKRLKSRMTDSRLMLLSTPAGQCFPSRNSTATASRDSVRETAICRTIELVKLVWYGKGRVCRTNLSTQSRVQQSLPQPGTQQPLPQPRAQQPLPHSPEPSSHFRSPGSSSHFRSQGPSAKATRYRKRGRSYTAGFCKRATEPYLCRSRRP